MPGEWAGLYVQLTISILMGTVKLRKPSEPLVLLWRIIYKTPTNFAAEYQRDQRGVAPADCWNWGKWRLIWKGSFRDWFVGLVVPVQEIFVLPWLLLLAQYKMFFFLTAHSFTSFVPIAQQAWQAVVPRRMSSNMCLCWICTLIQYPCIFKSAWSNTPILIYSTGLGGKKNIKWSIFLQKFV